MFTHFYAVSLSIKACFYEASNVFYLGAGLVLTKLFGVSENSIKIKVRSISDTFRNFYY